MTFVVMPSIKRTSCNCNYWHYGTLMQARNKSSEEVFGYLLGKSSRVLLNRMQHRFLESGHNVTFLQWVILSVLANQDGITQQKIADTLEKDKTTVTRILDSMEKRDLIVRISDKADRRQKVIHMTNRGKEAEQELMTLAVREFDSALKGIKHEELKMCSEILERICDNVAKA